LQIADLSAVAGEPAPQSPPARHAVPADVTLSVGEERELLRRERDQHKRNLYTLQEKKAKYGSLEVPLSVLNQIEDEEREIARLDAALAALGDSDLQK
jgi:hypothetical protein